MLKPSNQRRIQTLIDAILRDARPRLGEGRLPEYIPELAKVDPKKLGIAIATVDGAVLSTAMRRSLSRSKASRRFLR